MLQPLEDNHEDTISERAINGTEQLLAEEARSLYYSENEYCMLSPAAKAAKALEAPTKPTEAAQLAADSGNLIRACAILCNNSKMAPINDAFIAKVRELHPQEGDDGESTEVSSPVVGIDNACNLLAFFRNMPTGKGRGLDSNVTNTLRSLALATKGNGYFHPYLGIAWDYLLLLFILNNIQDEVQEEFASQILMMLHKVSPNLALKLQLINVGTSPQHCAAGITAKHNSPRFAERLLPLNFGVAVKGGAQFVFHCLQAAFSEHVFRTKDQLAAGDLPTRVLILIDLHKCTIACQDGSAAPSSACNPSTSSRFLMHCTKMQTRSGLFVWMAQRNASCKLKDFPRASLLVFSLPCLCLSTCSNISVMDWKHAQSNAERPAFMLMMMMVGVAPVKPSPEREGDRAKYLF